MFQDLKKTLGKARKTSKKRYFVDGNFSWNILNEIGLSNEIGNLMKVGKGGKIFLMNLNVYMNLVNEFYRALEIPRKRMRNVTSYIVKFRFQNLHWEMILKKFVE